MKTTTARAGSALPRLLLRPAPLVLPHQPRPRPRPAPPPPQRRAFFSLPTSPAISPLPTQTLEATRLLPYHHADLYRLIADVDSYSAFLPYCTLSRVTRWSEPDPDGRTWPTLADLRIGWGGFDETYTSRLCCIPPRGIVEAISGDAVSDLPERASLDAAAAPGQGTAAVSSTAAAATAATPPGRSVLRCLVTRWTVRPAPGGPRGRDPMTEAHLSVKFQFNNAMYAAVSAAVSGRVAAVMIEAFENRARQVLDNPRR